MAQQSPKMLDHPLYELLQDEDIEGFNTLKASASNLDFSGGHFRGLDLRGIDADGIKFTGAYFRGADLRGVDLRNAILEGASIGEAKISGAYFPKDLPAEEIRLSLEKGIRMRYR